MKASLPITVLIGVVAGCANVQVTPLNPPPYAMNARQPDEVQVFVTRAPEAPYQEIYLIRSDADNSENAMRAMRERAAELGCDGIVITGNADRVVSTPDARGNASVAMREGFLASCIVFE